MQTEYLTSTAAPCTVSSRRKDLLCLCGLAVALVVVDHVWLGRASAGIDVLLVVTGFFFGERLLRPADRDRVGVQVVRHVARMARRLVPPLVIVVAVSGLLTLWLQPRTRWETFADHSLSTFGFIQNWQLVQSGVPYARAGEVVSPLQHTWAISMLAQLFLVGLLMTWVIGASVPARRRRAVLVGAVGVLAVASFGFAMIAHHTDQGAAFYNTFARAWQPLAGVLAAALVGRLHVPEWVRIVAVAVGVTTIVVTGTVIDGAEHFPGPLAVLPVAAAVLVICGVMGGTDIDRWWTGALRAEPLPALGGMAYALYLWHWPVLTFWLARSEKDAVGPTDGLLVVAAALALAYLTNKLVERPLRAPRRPVERARVGATVLACVVALSAITVMVGAAGWRQYTNAVRANGAELQNLSLTDYPGGRALIDGLRVPKLPVRPTVLEAADDLPASVADGCISDFGNSALARCTYGDPKASRTIALAGGSHSEHWLVALDRIGQRHGFKVVTYLKMGCPLTTDKLPRVSVSNDPYPGCRDWIDSAMASMVADRPDYVFITTTRPRPEAPGDFVPESYLGIWDMLAANDIAILGMRDTPWMYHDGFLFSPVDCLADGGDPNSDTCGLPRSEVLADYNPTMDYLGRYPLLAPLDMSDAICRPDFCRAVEGNVMVYHDAHHLSATYVRTLSDELARQLAAATGWW